LELLRKIKNPLQELTIHKSIEETPLKDYFIIAQIVLKYNTYLISAEE
jgi:hypothetical protein